MLWLSQENPDEVCPAGWQPGGSTMKPDPVGCPNTPPPSPPRTPHAGPGLAPVLLPISPHPGAGSPGGTQ